MAASFRSKAEVLALAGCDFLTISPGLLEELSQSKEVVERRLDADWSSQKRIEKAQYNEKEFRFAINEDPCATVKLAEGIRIFNRDIAKLESALRDLLPSSSA
jgi:transaldolase